MKVDDLVSVGEAMHADLGREYYLTGAGLKRDPEFQSIYDRHAELSGDAALDVARESGIDALVEWIVGLRVGRAVAPFEERQLTWEQGATLTVDGREISYLRAPIELRNSPDRAFRLALDRELTRVGTAGLNGLRRDRFALEHEIVGGLGLGSDYVASISALSGIALDALGDAADTLLRQTADLYLDALTRLVRRRLGIRVDELERADTGWVFRAETFDAAFPPDALVATAVRQMGEMGLDATQAGRVKFDTDERSAKQPRAFCAPVHVPREVYLVIRPSGGHTDYRTFWHELGHAMHFAAVDPERPFHERWLGDNSVTEAFAMLWDHLTLHRGWLRRYTDLSGNDVDTLRFELAVSELYMLRRYAAKLRYELAFHRSGLTNGLGAVGAVYAQHLTDATLFRFPEQDHLRDVDPGFYAARYLRAWQLEAALAASLTDRFDEDWYRNPRAGAFIQQFMSRGQADPADRLAAEVTGEALSFAPAVRRVEAVLA
ncbi:MAG: hypothetical protein IH965_01425 [Gemmatimonadetes bacterium]|nr:hypothetical protein [Gemmatimonadota bacterium]